MKRTLLVMVVAVLAVAGSLAALAPTVASLVAQAGRAVAAPTVDAPMRMDVGHENPLLLTQMNIGNDMGRTPGFKKEWNSGWSMAQIWAAVPDDIKGNIGFVLHQGHNGTSDSNPLMSEQWLRDNVAEADALGIPVFILWDEGRTLRSNGTRFSFLESLYQQYPHFMGTVVSEQADTLNDLPEALRIANLYGGFHVLGSLEETDNLVNRMETQSYWDSVARYKQNFIYNPKNFHENFESVNAWAKGAWLAGAFDNWGPYFDGYPYYGCGYFGLNTSYAPCGDRWSRSMAESVASMMMLDQWQNGATVFHLENQLDIPTTGSLYSPYFYQSILPAMRYILGHDTPSREDVVASTGVAFDDAEGRPSALADSTADNRGGNPPRTTFFSMYEQSPELTAVNKTLWYYLRTSGRYGMIPRIPKLAPAALRQALTASGATLLTKPVYDRTMQYGDARNALLDAAYPEISTGDAFVQRSGADWLVYNSHERDNFTEDTTLRLTGDTFTQLTMPEVTPHTWAMLNEGDDGSVSMTLDTYATDRTADLLRPAGRRDMEFNRNFVKYAYVPEPQDAALRTTTLQFTVAAQPTLTISGYDDNDYTYQETYDPDQDLYTLVIRSNGVVDIGLTTGAAEAGWTAPAPDQVVASGGATELTFDGTSVAWAAGAVSASIDGVAVDPATRRATGLSNSVHVLRVEGPALSTQEFRYLPSVEHGARDLESNDFNYGTREADDDVLNGSEGWRVIDGRLKLVGYVFPFYGDTTVYNTNTELADVRYEATMTLVNGTSGSMVVRGDEDAKTGYVFRLDPSRSNEGRNGTAAYSCQLLRNQPSGALNSAWAPLATCPESLTLAPNTPYDVELTADGDTITASIDGTTVLTYSGATDRAAGWTGIRSPMAQSDKGGGCTPGGNQTTSGAFCLGQFMELDDVTVTDLSSDAVVYTSDFAGWDDARGWMTETPLVFDWHTRPDPRSSYSFPYDWATAGAAAWDVVETDVFTSGHSGYYAGRANEDTDLVAHGGAGSAWAGDGGYDHWAWLRVSDGDQAGLVVRASGAQDMYQARLDVAADRVSFGSVVGGTWTELASAPSPVDLAPGDWTLLKVSARGPLITVDVDGREALRLTDRTHPTGDAGVWVAAGGAADVDDARVVARPAVPTAAPSPAITVVPGDGVAERHITGFEHLAVRTARTRQPALPAQVTARFSDGTTGPVDVSWPAIGAEQLAVATNPTVTGPERGRFPIEGTVAGTDLRVPILVTVMPNLTTAFDITGTYDPANPTVPTQIPGIGTFSDGTSTWTKYLYVRWDTTPATAPGSPREQVITGTINGYPWEKLTARITVQVQPAAPDAPTGVSAVPGAGRATVGWTAPASDGGSPLTGYTATAAPGGSSCTTTGETTCSVPDLVNGTPYTFTVTATNAAGSSPASAPSAPVTPATTVPGFPTAVEAVATDGRASVRWTAPGNDGGTPVTGYTVTAAPGGATCSARPSAGAGATTCDIGGLTNGTAYRFVVTATNAAGPSAPSAPSPAVVPGTGAVPPAPGAVVAVPGNGRATVSWQPSSDPSVTEYRVTASPGGAVCTTTTTTCAVRGLQNDVAHTFTVRARNPRGLSPASAASAAVTPTAANLALRRPVTSYYTFGGSNPTNNANRVPGRMVDGDAAGNDTGFFTGGNSEGALLNYVAPGGDLCSWAYVDLGADVELGGYEVQFGQNSTQAGNRMYDSPYRIQVLSSADATATSTDLRNSSPCPARTFARGTGHFSTPQYVVTDEQDVWTTVAAGTGTLTLDAHGLDRPVTARYVRILLDEPRTAQVYGTAVNELRLFASAAPAAPEPPSAVQAVAGDGAARVSWAPGPDGGSPLTGYTVTASPGGLTCTAPAPNSSATTCDVTGLTNGTTYTFAVTATSVAGTSAPSDPSPPVRPVGAPVLTPTTTTATLVLPSQQYGTRVPAPLMVRVRPAGPGTVVIRDGDAVLASGLALNAAGIVLHRLPATLPPGPHALRAEFVPAPGAPVAASISEPVTLTVTKAPSRLQADVEDRTVDEGRRVRLDVTLRVTGAEPAGVVEIRDGELLLGSVAVPPSGRASVQLPPLPPGRYQIQVRYPGTDLIEATDAPPIQLRVGGR